MKKYIIPTMKNKTTLTVGEAIRWLHLRYATVRVTASGNFFIAENAYESAYLLGPLEQVQEMYDHALREAR